MLRGLMVVNTTRRGNANPLYLMAAGSTVVLAVIAFLMARGTGDPRTVARPTDTLTMYCAAGVRPPVAEIAEQYEKEYGVHIQIEYGGSNTLLSRLEVARTGDLYLAADDSYTNLAREKGLVRETIPVATMKPVILVAGGNPKMIHSISDLLRDDVRVALGNPDQAAIGRKVRRLLKQSGHWDALEKRVSTTGVFKPTVPEVANDVKLGSVDAAIVWDAVAGLYPELEAVSVPELDAGSSQITVGIVSTSTRPTAALKFARYLSARDRGLKVFARRGFHTVEGDVWSERPQLTFFAGSVNRRALEPILRAFAQREGVEVNTVYNGCGILTAQMRALQSEEQTGGFPDAYMACDVYYMKTVADLFQDAVNVSNTDIVIVVQEGNPKQIHSLHDLSRPGVRVALGQPDQCTIGVLSRRLLESEGLYEKIMRDNVVTQTATSALLVPNVTTGAADAALAYRTDTLSEEDRIDVIPIDSPLAKAVQPYGIARWSPHKQLAKRLYEAIAAGREQFEASGFRWQLEEKDAARASASP